MTDELFDDSQEKMYRHLNTMLCHTAELLANLRKISPEVVETASIHITLDDGRAQRHLCFPCLPKMGSDRKRQARRWAEATAKQADCAAAQLAELEEEDDD